MAEICGLEMFQRYLMVGRARHCVETKRIKAELQDALLSFDLLLYFACPCTCFCTRVRRKDVDRSHMVWIKISPT
jgi:hypothetical protein